MASIFCTIAGNQLESWMLPDYPGFLGELEPGKVAVAMGEGVGSCLREVWGHTP
jgi:hypothetical protein